MSNQDLARRTAAEVYFDGVDISTSVRKYLISFTYTDNEEDEADDLQIKLEDRDGIWLTKWLNAAVEAAAETLSVSEAAAATQYKVTAKSGLNVRSGPGTSHGKLGALAFGAAVDVSVIENGWATISYSGKTAYVSANYIESAGTSSGSTSSADGTGGSSVAVGDIVQFLGGHHYISADAASPTGAACSAGPAKVTNIALGAKHPYHLIHADSQSQVYGWVDSNTISGLADTSEDSGSTIGLRIQAVFVRENRYGDGKDTVLDCGQFELDSVTAAGPPSEITVKCTSLPYNAQIRQTKKSRAWEGYTLSGIANDMAAAGGMACLYESNYDPYYERVEQVTESDISCLSTLCRNAGISLKATNNILVLFDQAAYEEKDAVKTIAKGDGSYLKYKLSTGESDTHYASCRVSCVNPATGTLITATAYIEDYDAENEDNQFLEITAKVNSVGEAQKLAEKRLRLQNKYERSASFTLPGDPELVAGVTVMLSGWGSWDGKYIIKQAKHAIGSSGYTTQISLRRVLEGY